jgi:hypothetical protein
MVYYRVNTLEQRVNHELRFWQRYPATMKPLAAMAWNACEQIASLTVG